MKGFVACLIPAALLVACAGKPAEPSFGEQLMAEENPQAQSLGKNWNKGQSYQEQGDKLISEGNKDIRKGDKLVSQGKSKVKKGEALLKRGAGLKTKTENVYHMDVQPVGEGDIQIP